MDIQREMLKGNTPTLVLAVLADTALHGYAIAREIERRSKHALKFKEGTLYPVLHALERKELIKGEWQKENGGRERKIYSITPAGVAALAHNTRTWNHFASAIGRVIGGQNDVEQTRTATSGDFKAAPAP